MNNKKKLNLFFFIGLLMCFILSSCDPVDRLTIINESISDFYFFYSCDSSLSDLTIFRNGYYENSEGDSVYVFSDQYVEKESTQNIPRRGLNAWSYFFKKCETDIVHFYFFKETIVSSYPDSVIISRKMYNKHYSFSKKELKENDWVVTYP